MTNAAAGGAVITSPGTYLRLRREAADLSVVQVAQAVSSGDVGLAAAVEAIRAAEADEALLQRSDLARLERLFAFRPGVYGALVDGAIATGICALCGCTNDDACEISPGVGCSWTDDSRTLCNAHPGRLS